MVVRYCPEISLYRCTSGKPQIWTTVRQGRMGTILLKLRHQREDNTVHPELRDRHENHSSNLLTGRETPIVVNASCLVAKFSGSTPNRHFIVGEKKVHINNPQSSFQQLMGFSGQSMDVDGQPMCVDEQPTGSPRPWALTFYNVPVILYPWKSRRPVQGRSLRIIAVRQEPMAE